MNIARDILAAIGGLAVFCWVVLLVWITVETVRDHRLQPDALASRDRIGVRR